MKSYHWLAVAALFLMVMSGSVDAQQAAPGSAAPAAPVSPQAVPQAAPPAADPQFTANAQTFAAAKELVGMLDMGKQFKAVFDIIGKNMQSIIMRDNPNRNAQVNQLIHDTISKVFMSHMDEFTSNAALVYANTYTYDELEQIIAFYKTPVGQKMLQSLPQTMEKSMALNRSIITMAVKESMQQLGQQLRQNGMKVPKEMGI